MRCTKLLLAFVLLAACSSKPEEPAAVDAPKESEPTVQPQEPVIDLQEVPIAENFEAAAEEEVAAQGRSKVLSDVSARIALRERPAFKVGSKVAAPAEPAANKE